MPESILERQTETEAGAETEEIERGCGMSQAAARSVRRTRAVESFTSAEETIGQIEPNMALFAITRGQFSMLDAIRTVLKQTGKSYVSIWTWAIADYEVECFEAFMADREISGALLVIDHAAENRNAALIQQWRDRFGADSARVCKNHAKIARVWNDDWRVLLRGSMNLNFNPRFEQFDITEGGPDYDLVEEIENALPVLRPRASKMEAMNASRLGMAFEAGTLEMFAGIKTWCK